MANQSKEICSYYTYLNYFYHPIFEMYTACTRRYIFIFFRRHSDLNVGGKGELSREDALSIQVAEPRLKNNKNQYLIKGQYHEIKNSGQTLAISVVV